MVALQSITLVEGMEACWQQDETMVAFHPSFAYLDDLKTASFGVVFNQVNNTIAIKR